MTDVVLDDACALLADLIGFPTVTAAPNLELIDRVEELLTGLGARTQRTYDPQRTKANLLATIGPDVDGGVVLSGHTDVVPADHEDWTGAPFVAAQRGDRIHGRGACDMKGFIACVLAVAPRFAQAPLRAPVHIALTFDEEVGCHGAPLLIDGLTAGGVRPRAAIVGEPTSMRIVGAHKGCYEFTTLVTGVEGHGSLPDHGVNAVEIAARYITRLVELRDELARDAPPDSPFDPPAATVSVGTVEGGSARNVVAGECRFDWELRSVTAADVERVDAAVAELERQLNQQLRKSDGRAGIATSTVGAVGGLAYDPRSEAIELTRRLVDDPEIAVVPFGTEAGLYQQAGIPAVVCGPGSIDVAHRPDEYVTVGQLKQCLDMLDRLCDELCRRR